MYLISVDHFSYRPRHQTPLTKGRRGKHAMGVGVLQALVRNKLIELLVYRSIDPFISIHPTILSYIASFILNYILSILTYPTYTYPIPNLVRVIFYPVLSRILSPNAFLILRLYYYTILLYLILASFPYPTSYPSYLSYPKSYPISHPISYLLSYILPSIPCILYSISDLPCPISFAVLPFFLSYLSSILSYTTCPSLSVLSFLIQSKSTCLLIYLPYLSICLSVYLTVCLST